MIEVVTSRNAGLYKDALVDMFQLRHRILAENICRDVVCAADGRDAFDTDDAIYLLLTADDGTVIGSHRLLPTTGPHLFSDVLPQCCDVKGVQRGAAIVELTRTCVDEALPDKATMETARKRIMVGLFEFCLRAGYQKFTLLMPTDLLFRYLVIGLQIKPLGLPLDVDGVEQVAVIVTVDAAAFDAMRLALGIPERQVNYLGALAGDPLVLAPGERAYWPLDAAG
ncbi:MAG TPA: acyl-homoserine-lactone synthase [Rhizomicrobium sp.]|nr:acyl-homoserine-lactone synthase [Rhizomicrobium sp.]